MKKVLAAIEIVGGVATLLGLTCLGLMHYLAGVYEMEYKEGEYPD